MEKAVVGSEESTIKSSSMVFSGVRKELLFQIASILIIVMAVVLYNSIIKEIVRRDTPKAQSLEELNDSLDKAIAKSRLSSASSHEGQ
jgi:hypothetical protein